MGKKNNALQFILRTILAITAVFSLLILALHSAIPILDIHPIHKNLIDFTVLCIFTITALLRFFTVKPKKEYFKNYWLDFIVIIPCLYFLKGIYTACLFVIIHQALIFLRQCFRKKVIEKIISLLGLKPAQLLAVSFLMTILLGAVLLTLPLSTKNGEGLSFVDALFTATSATCVTGLIVQDTGNFFSLFGQCVILLLIQVGALGIMTFSVTLFLAAGKSISNREAMAMQDVLDQDSIAGILELVIFIAKMTIIIELLGTIFLYFGFEPYISDPGQRMYVSVFHSISAFCNAGFSVFPDSLMKFSRDVTINLTISFLIIFGGLGFIVVKDIRDKYIKDERPKSIGLKLHTKLVLVMTIILLIAGTVFIYFAEYNQILKGMPFRDQILISFFQSVSARTAGFNTVDIGRMNNASLFVIIILMFIGASAGSTGGGIKTTTFWVIIESFFSNLKNKDNISVFKRKIPDSIVGKSIAIFVLSLALVIVFMYLVSCYETQISFRDLIFEVVSAFGTVGLSCGITGSLHVPGKLLITILMFLGRLGPLTAVLAFAGYKRKINYTYAEEKLMVG
ncbi:MAG: TrkH family potassium uptake protein [Candidatus Omnitrophota bacterium]